MIASALLALVGALISATLLHRARGQLRPTGPVPVSIALAGAAARVVALAAAARIAFTFAPDDDLFRGPIPALIAVLGVGFSVRDLLPDLVGWLVITGQGRVRAGRRVEGASFGGRVESVGLLSTVVGGVRGSTAVPNRRFVGEALTISELPYAPVELLIPLPGVPAAEARRVLREAVFLSPWIAPSPSVEIGMDPSRHDQWRVRVSVLESRFAEPFFGSFSERVHEVLTQSSTPPHPPE